MERNARLLAIWLLSSCFAASGCASIFNAGTWGSGPMPPYGGFGAEVGAVAHVIANPPPPSEFTGPNLAMGVLVLVDMPFSFAMDTIFLPACLISKLEYATQRKARAATADCKESNPASVGPAKATRAIPPDPPDSSGG